MSLIKSASSSGIANDLYSALGFPISALILYINSHKFLISAWATFIASSILSSGTSFAPASIIHIFVGVADTVKSKIDFSLWAKSGFKTISPSTIPTLTVPTNVSNGISDILRAIDAPTEAGISGNISGSTAKTRAFIAVSFL